MERRRRAVSVLTAIETVDRTGSTNADVAALARTGADEGFWRCAHRQDAGRGRHGRVWESPPGNFAGSTLVRWQITDPPAASLALVAGVAVHQAIMATRPTTPARLKWPNDVMLGHAKVAGILLEREHDAVVVGVGVNLAYAPTGLDRPVTCLADHGVRLDLAGFAPLLAEAFAHWLAVWRGDGLAAIREAWLARAHPRGTALRVRDADGGAIEGGFDGLDADGALMLGVADGGRHVIHAGDVFLI